MPPADATPRADDAAWPPHGLPRADVASPEHQCPFCGASWMHNCPFCGASCWCAAGAAAELDCTHDCEDDEEEWDDDDE